MLFSVVVPIYNVAPYLRRCLDSLLVQSFSDFEVLCMDDGSTDECGGIVDEYAIKDARIRVVHQKNAGVSVTRNTAFDLARGDWIASIDGDDEVGPDWLKHFAIAIMAHSADLYWTDFIEHKAGVDRVVKQDVLEDPKTLVNAALRGEFFGCVWNKVFRRSLVNAGRIRCPDKRVHSREDLCLVCSYLARCAKVKYIPVADYIYRIRKGSSIHYGALTPFADDMLVNDLIENSLVSLDFASGRRYLRQMFKFQYYDRLDVADYDWYSLYPEITDTKGLKVPAHHRILFKIAILHGRCFVRWLLSLIRGVKAMR